MTVSCVAIAMLVGVEPTAWPAPRLSPNVTKASGLVSQPPGSAGNCSRQATTKLLACPLARAAQGWLSSDVACSGWGWNDGKHGTWRRRGPHKFFLEGAGRFGGASSRVDLCEDENTCLQRIDCEILNQESGQDYQSLCRRRFLSAGHD